eukprot:GHVU01147675.1.p1 GENE.GHVU01147675.1~~GHVU01147675.1.p1  ORF type:complete len:333 (-),score=42.21 GHVU01147675.1:756-1754(-)
MDPEVLRKVVDQRDLLTCTIEGPRDVSTLEYGGTFSSIGMDETFDLEKFKREVTFHIRSMKDDLLVFELVGVSPAIANAFRRIMIAEVPTVAPELIKVYQNTGVIQDEVLSHRLGLIPIRIDPELFQDPPPNGDLGGDNAVCFKLHIVCKEAKKTVYASDLEWIPLSAKQQERLKFAPPEVVHPDIPITVLNRGQEIELFAYCTRGIGKTHAKWSPVATASYRLLPVISFPSGDLTGEEARELKELCPKGVFDIEDGVAVAKEPLACSTCRACIERFPNQVKLQKVKTHFIFSIESTGCIPAASIFERSVDILMKKASTLRKNLTRTIEQHG